jgi:hypothetical protein
MVQSNNSVARFIPPYETMAKGVARRGPSAFSFGSTMPIILAAKQQFRREP